MAKAKRVQAQRVGDSGNDGVNDSVDHAIGLMNANEWKIANWMLTGMFLALEDVARNDLAAYVESERKRLEEIFSPLK